MSVYSYVQLKCDKCGELGLTADVGAREARKDAKRLGWKVGKKADFCPGCAAKIKEAIKAAASGNL